MGIEGYGEPVAARAPDGSLLAVLRTGNAPLYQARSLDGGRNWSTPSPLPGYDFPLEQNVDPELITADGVMYLSYGDPQSGTDMRSEYAHLCTRRMSGNRWGESWSFRSERDESELLQICRRRLSRRLLRHGQHYGM